MGISGTSGTRQGIVMRIGTPRGPRKNTGSLRSGSGPLRMFETALAVAPGDMVEYAMVQDTSVVRVTKVYPRGGKR